MHACGFSLFSFAFLAASAGPPPLSSYAVEADVGDAAASVGAAAALVARFVALAAAGGAAAPPLPVYAPGGAPAGTPVIAVGFKAASRLSPPPPPGGWASLGAEGHALASGLGAGGACAAATGADGAPRGTLYAAIALLEALGCRFWAPNATSFPAAPVAALPPLGAVFVPPLEYRSTDNWQVQGPGFGPWSVLVRENDAADPTDGAPKPGGGVAYVSPPGFANNADVWVSPSDPVGKLHPEWFGGSHQLCYTAPGLIDFLIVRARQFIAGDPAASILTLAQNDNQDYCKTPAEQAAMDAEGSPMAPLLRAVNAIAANLSADFPALAVDTLAYQYTRKAPNVTKPLPNVIVRLCSIECNFRVPMSDPLEPANAAFAKDLEAWAGISKRLYIWDYIVNFANSVMPFPNYPVLAPNIRYLAANSVRGIFEEGVYWAFGSELQELRSYVTLKLLYDPSQDEGALISDFLSGFYGPAGAPAVAAYMASMVQSAADTQAFLSFAGAVTSPYLTPSVVLAAVAALGAAAAEAAQPFQLRIQTLWLAPVYATLLRWAEFKAWAAAQGVPWPLKDAALDAFADFSAVYARAGMNGTGALSEGRHDLAWLRAQLPA